MESNFESFYKVVFPEFGNYREVTFNLVFALKVPAELPSAYR